MATTTKHFACIILTSLRFFASATGIAALPHISTSVDDFRCVCPGETVYLTCSARGSWSHSWSSQDYFGRNAIIEFSQDYDRPGKGKRVSLSGGRSSLAQMTAIDSSNLQVRIPTGNLNETLVTCTNNRGATVTKTFIHSREPPPAPTSLQQTIIAENAIDSIQVYRFTWALPTTIDIKHLEFQVDNESAITLMNTSTEIVLPLSSDGEHNVSIIIVNRCGKNSEASVLQLNVINGTGVAYNDLTHHEPEVEDDLETSSSLIISSAISVTSMLNVSYFMLSLLFVFVYVFT